MSIIGIDLGTTNCCMAIVEGGRPLVITNAEGQRTTPSIVTFTKDGEILIGEAAKRQAVTNPDRTISSIKRHMGTDYKVNIDGKNYTPQEISAMILRKLKKDAEDYLGQPVREAVITVPAYFDEIRRQATKEAGQLAGFDVKRVINEPTAAAVAYGLDNDKKQTIMVYDLGGGTFDVSILRIEDGLMEVLSTCGDTALGGDDFDSSIASWLLEEFKKSTAIDLSNDLVSLQRIKEASENAKKELSSIKLSNINLPFLSMDSSGPKNLDASLSRSKFYSLTEELINRTSIPVRNALSDAELSPSDIDKVLLVGGSTRMISAQEKVKELIKKKPNKELNPDECVAIGAAIQGDKMSGNSSQFGLLLLDVTPLSLSIGTIGGISSKIIERNSPIPTKASKIMTTVSDGQTEIKVEVYQGERTFVDDNIALGSLILQGIPPMRAGKAEVEVVFAIDANGLLNVSAKDKGTGSYTEAIMRPKLLSKAEVENRIFSSKQQEENDKEREKATNMMIEVEDLLNEAIYNYNQVEHKLPESLRTTINSTLDEIREVLDEKNDRARVEDYDLFRKQKHKVMNAVEQMYKYM
jgi:molecular chaperone DnaK